MRLALQDIHQQRVGRLAELDVYVSVAECPAWSAGQTHIAIENPAQAIVPLQAAIEGQAQPSPTHRRHIGLTRAQLQPEPTGSVRSKPDGYRLQVNAGHGDGLRRQQHIRPRRQHPADPQQEAATQQKMA